MTKAWAVVAALTILLFAAHLLTRPPALPSFAEARAAWQPSEAWLYDRHGRLLDARRIDFAQRRMAWIALGEIAPALPAAVIAQEDRRFRFHDGVDWIGLIGSARDRLRGRSRGASTISMQLAAQLSPDLARPGARGVLDKLRQMRAAWALERRWRKDEIIEAYLNLAGWRGEAQGIAAAAWTLAGRPPARLDAADARLLAALLPSPQALPAAVAARACAGGGDCAMLRTRAEAMLGPTRTTALDPDLAPHLAARLLARPGLRMRTTLDAGVQRMAAEALRRQLLGLGAGRARDGAVVVVDNASGDVLAYVGGVGGASTAAAVDGADAWRQAGSTLKPFLYAEAIEGGWLTPASILDDSAVALDTASGLYVPQNYDRQFKGPVSVRSALAGSLNVPAVRALVLTGTEAFRDRLWDAGYRGLTEDGAYYGFSLALGSAEVTLLEQAAAYRTLARGGVYAPLRLRASDPRVPGRRVFSAPASWIVGDMLADPGARAVTFGLDSALKLPFWAAVKTGTSKGMRDNWCIGFTDRFTVAVWVGNLEGDAMRAVSGVSGAAPVWRAVMLALHRDAPGRAPPPPAGVEARAVRFAGGIEPSRRDWFLKGAAQTEMAAAPAAARRPRILSPLSGAVYALDPDIPLDRQRLRVTAGGATQGLRLVLDGRDVGAGEAGALLLPGPGAHRLALVGADGVKDRVLFTVR
ncbi:penicillin-binding protein 1C [Sphingomonas jatrophae]|uniref:peptidoglycan glycosyltransferase n=1 Tax=Sphingomonas jatrophae TaxID=1166337 RepID=A0A1I6LPJ1_9SPHN|nr:penicillin-binding protein 1C [Sphingomonas jatrophae]